MPYIARMFPALVMTSSGAGGVTNAVSQCDDASNISITVTTSASAASYNVQISLYEPGVQYSTQQVVSSAAFFTLQNVSSSVLYSVSPGQSIIISNVAFQQLRLLPSTGAGVDSSGTTIAFAAKQITV
jgi:hypothetical protein